MAQLCENQNLSSQNSGFITVAVYFWYTDLVKQIENQEWFVCNFYLKFHAAIFTHKGAKSRQEKEYGIILYQLVGLFPFKFMFILP